jgi:hypothetical protein
MVIELLRKKLGSERLVINPPDTFLVIGIKDNPPEMSPEDKKRWDAAFGPGDRTKDWK